MGENQTVAWCDLCNEGPFHVIHERRHYKEVHAGLARRKEALHSGSEESAAVVMDDPGMRQPSEADDALTVNAPGCAIMDSGATAGVVSLSAADDIQEQRLRQGEPHESTVTESTKIFRLGDGHAEKASVTISQPVTAGLLKGQTLDLHCIDKRGNDTLPLFPISEMKRLGMVVDFEQSSISFKSQPGKWHKMPTTPKGLMLIPITKEAVEQFQDQANAVTSAGDK